MPRAGIEPATHGFSVHCSTNWAIWARLLKTSCGGRIWTYDLRVMSPTSFQTAPPRDIKLMDGGGFEPPKQNAADLQSVPFGLSGIRPFVSLRTCIHKFKKKKPMIGLEPITCWLQISCSANWATSAWCEHLLFHVTYMKMPRAGIEPATRGFSVLCSTNWAIWANTLTR